MSKKRDFGVSTQTLLLDRCDIAIDAAWKISLVADSYFLKREKVRIDLEEAKARLKSVKQYIANAVTDPKAK